MIKRSKQDWSVGSWVRVGFLTLRVEGARAVKDGLPDIYTLSNAKGELYEFIPHNGLVKL